jgi:tRNA(fMet)-specific endonuclease VapC
LECLLNQKNATAIHWCGLISSLKKILRDFSVMQLVSFDKKAAEVFDDLNHKSLRVGSMDLRIASIAIANQMTLATQKSVGFERVPGLSIQDWLV